RYARTRRPRDLHSFPHDALPISRRPARDAEGDAGSQEVTGSSNNIRAGLRWRASSEWEPHSKFFCLRILDQSLFPSKRRSISKMIAFGCYGGKFSHLDFILPLLPSHYTHFCQPFGGSAAVF